MGITYKRARDLLEKRGQDHVLGFWADLDRRQRAGLLSQVESLDFGTVTAMQALLRGTAGTATGEIVPARVVHPTDKMRREAADIGEQAICGGKVGVIMVAGGQGSRLGFEGPKGCFPVAPITNASLHEIHARKILALEQRYDTSIPLYVMTSESNHRATSDFFEQYEYFGLSKQGVNFFVQGMMPALDGNGKFVLDRRDHIFMGPDGHGGVLSALAAGGIIDDMAKRGIETLFYFQVDNPLVAIADPAFVGFHRAGDTEMSLKVCARRGPEERVGVVAERDGSNVVVEYSELTREQKHAVSPDGGLKFRFGSVAIHIFSLNFISRQAAARPPLHAAHKKVPYCDASGNTVTPAEPNAYKFEKFVFDVLPGAKRTLNLEFVREDEFSPVKNASGSDSRETARRDMILKWARWLEACGVVVPRDGAGVPLHRIEIDPCFASAPEDLKRKLPADFRVTNDVLLA